MTKSLVLGIDTGGTYTDGVLLEYNTHKIIATHKSLTTKRDFSIGIENVIAAIDIQNPASIQMVSISTTLATNAIAEGKGKRVALFLIGYDPELITSFKFENSFATPNYFYITGGHDLYGEEKEKLDLSGLLAKVNEVKNRVDAIAVSSYFSPRNPEHEIRARRAIASVCDLPIVLGHQLSTKLGSVERATTAALNASLMSILQDFIIAVHRAMERRGIEAPVMVVRGDGTLMNEEFAARTPVETIHSGPAASAMGGRFLSNLDDALVVDVGGTTTDLAFIKGGQVAISEEGATAAGYKTSVKAANLLSIGLGGDSHISLNRSKKVAVGPERVVPLAYLAQQYPNVQQRLRATAKRSLPAPTPDELEYWFLQRDLPEGISLKSSSEEKLLQLLKNGPKPVPVLMKELGFLAKSQFESEVLWREEIVGKAGFTPTDLLHCDGRHTPWNVAASQAALTIFSNYLAQEKEAFAKSLWNMVTEKTITAILGFLTERKIPHNAPKEFGGWILNNSIYPSHPHLKTQIQLLQPIIGIGAPAKVMLQEAADKLHTELVLPNHYSVANAVGAIAGSVMVTEEILIYPHLSHDGTDVIGFYVQARDEREEYVELEDALNKAHQLGQQRAKSAALRSGADNPQIVLETEQDGMDSYRVRAIAIGKPRLAD
ncbi:MAG: hydantoinase/oxoprolinase family protein [Chloroflexota bacterium]|nr:hydantoinase/oxoprolinase family protein [Chloroflexota bacterium]